MPMFMITDEERYGRHSMYNSREDWDTYNTPRHMERMYDRWADKFDDTKVSLRKSRHSYEVKVLNEGSDSAILLQDRWGYRLCRLGY